MTLKQTDIDETMLVELIANNSSKIKQKTDGAKVGKSGLKKEKAKVR